MEVIRTLKLRIKDRHARVLNSMAREVNTVWNFCNETSWRAIRERQKFLSGFDLQKLTDGYSKCEGVQIGSATTQQVCEEYATRRRQFRRARLNWRVSSRSSPKRSLGWIPFKARALRYRAGQVFFAGKLLSLWDSFGLAQYDLRAGSFSEDARGRWYLNVQVKLLAKAGEGQAATGIDLGLKTAATCSDGEVLESGVYRRLEDTLGVAQRARKKARVRSLHAKIANVRKDAMHKFSTKVVARSGAVFVGDVAPAKLVKTAMAKSTLDAGWSMLKTMLEYKSHGAGIVFKEVNEAYTTQDCSACGSRTGPKGLGELSVRHWRCSVCGTEHDRDVNAAINIRSKGLVEMEERFAAAAEARAVEPAVNEARPSGQAAPGHGRPAGGIPVL